MTTNEAEKRLIEAGAVREKREDVDGKTRSGWWLDGVFLGRDAKTAFEGLNG